MSKEALAKVVQRSISDAAFRRQLATDPTGALRRYDLTADEAAAIRHGDSARLTALGVEQRMSKAFTLAAGDAGSLPSSSDLATGNIGAVQSPDAADRNFANSIGDPATSGAVQSPDAADRNFANSIGDPATSGPVQSPDAADRNFAYGTADAGASGAVQSPDAADRNFAYGTADAGASGAVQSPDAADRNFAYGTADAGASGAVQSPDAADRNFIGNNEALSNVMPSDATHALSGSELTDASTDEGFLPTVGYTDDVTTDADAGETTEATDIPHMPH
jgi:hypothetical protein